MKYLLFVLIVAISFFGTGRSLYPVEAKPAPATTDNSKYVLTPDTPFVANIPARVDGVVVDSLPRLEARTSSELPIYRLIIEVNGVPGVYPVDAETWVKAPRQTKYESGTITLDCDPLPCVKEKK